VANSLTNVIPQLLAQGLMALRQQSIMPRLVNRSYDSMAARAGSTIDIPIPSAITANAVTPGTTSQAVSDLSPTKATITLDQWYEAAFNLTDEELKNVEENNLMPMQASEAIKSLANNVDTYIMNLASSATNGINQHGGVAGTTPFASNLDAYLAARKELNNSAAPMDDRYCVIDADAEAEALSLEAFQNAAWRGDTDGIIRGQIGEKLGATWVVDQNIQSHTNANGTPTGFLANGGSGFAKGLTYIDADTGSNAPVVGDIFTVAGDTVPHVVTAVAAGGDYRLTISPALGAAVANNAALTFLASASTGFVRNLLFHRDAFAFATRPLEDGMMVGGNNVMAQADPVSGLSLRVEVTREFKQTRVSYDVLYGGALVRPELASLILG
jgi:hypothetical protein